MFQPYLADYRYYALFESQSHMSDIGRATGLYRSISAYCEERYEGHGRWELSIGLSMSSERDSYADYREASPAEVEYLKRRTDEQQQEQPQSSPGESAGVVALLAARRNAEPVDGHYYFAEFDELADVVDVDRAHALIRCPASGGGKWEMFLHEGTWVPGEEPRRKHVLPVGREDVERISRARETAEARYFDVWLGGTVENGLYRHVLVRRTGSADETIDDLGWQHTDVLRRLEPGWWVLELGERAFGSSRYVAVMMGRSRRFGDRRHDYQAFFNSSDDVYDFGKVLFLARRLPNPYELEYELLTPDGWKWVSGSLGGESLPISEEEFQRLAAPHPDGQGAGDVTR
ncbi:hypothetical protein SK854_45985 [Lentzea sp. BCCO 10_0061]|uniref:Uncharacterized protein n=1 Tax=Lentzea sokolovensis TaxID=3095429 RepID=A0ABU4VCK6_9PSEU|nr:hypothetical protein [Lentzea sp. BCCO 10_0061]MDX8149541.1 hypothetical protein [Lentzea sp. BCCO 10_0061]